MKQIEYPLHKCSQTICPDCEGVLGIRGSQALNRPIMNLQCTDCGSHFRYLHKNYDYPAKIKKVIPEVVAYSQTSKYNEYNYELPIGL